jgi:threonine dehydrogenase-like Zn-dependent dehydrogenase
LGLYALAMAVDKGLSNVLLIGAPAARLGIASEWGATKTLDLSTCADVQDRVDWVRSQTGSRGADVVINCASSQALSEAMRMVRPGGRISQIGTSGGAPISIPTHLLFRNITVTMPVMAEARHFYQAIQFVASRAERFDFSKIISGRFPLEGTGEALKRMANLEEVKPLITPHGVH